MIPAIWIGNFALIYLYKKLFVEKKINYVLASIAGIGVKVAVIFAGVSLLISTNIIPQASKIVAILYAAMGINQLITATIGSVLAFAILKTVYRKKVC